MPERDLQRIKAARARAEKRRVRDGRTAKEQWDSQQPGIIMPINRRGNPKRDPLIQEQRTRSEKDITWLQQAANREAAIERANPIAIERFGKSVDELTEGIFRAHHLAPYKWERNTLRVLIAEQVRGTTWIDRRSPERRLEDMKPITDYIKEIKRKARKT